jgi:hypothetical protein
MPDDVKQVKSNRGPSPSASEVLEEASLALGLGQMLTSREFGFAKRFSSKYSGCFS